MKSPNHNTDKDGLPMVSVCVPTYNHAGFIKDCLDGILAQQTDFSFEIIVGEDDSSDATRSICIEYAKRHPELIRLFLRSRKDVIYINGKPSGRYNFTESLKSCRGKYIALCEGDDFWTDPFKLQKQVDHLEANPDHAICFHAAVIRYTDGSQPDQVSNKEQKTISTFEDLAMGNYINTATCLFRNQLKGNFPSWFYSIAVGDWPLHLLHAQYGKIFFIPEPMSVYRINPSSLWGNQSQEVMYRRIFNVLETLKNEFPENCRKYFDRSISAKYMSLSEYFERKGFKWKALLYFYKAGKASDLYKVGLSDMLHKIRTKFFAKR